MSTAPRDPHSRPVAVPAGGGPTRRKWLLPLLLGLLALIALLVLLSQCGGDDKDDDRPAATPTTTATATATVTSPANTSPAAPSAAATGTGQAGGAGTVTAAGTNLLDAASAATLSAQDTQQAVGRAVKVQSVPADEGFWVGTSEQDRLWVQLSGTRGESDYKVKQGDTVDFTGTVTKAASDFATKVGVTAAEGADQLVQQGYYVSVPASSVKLSS
ncbi:hypothetical protein AB0G04_36120 [Actinoplanes sp. NPDC023801]|uniref:hypothetical protein n=1 Tax=Actinoplanes sp. NPDC023801 TaxID=3154595 RepID=UPI0033F7FF25